MARFTFLTYCGSLRGSKNPKVILHDIYHHILSPEESEVLMKQGNYSPPNVYLILLGRFKDISQEG